MRLSVRTRTCFTLLLPIALPMALVLGVLCLPWFGTDLEQAIELIGAAIYGIGALVAWRFGRSRVVLALAGLGLGWFCTAHPLAAWGSGISGGLSPVPVIGLLLPLNLAAWALLPERGFLSLRGLMQPGLVLAQVFLVLWVTDATPGLVSALAHPFVDLPDWLPIRVPSLTVASTLVAAVAMGICLWRRRTPVESAFVGALMVSFFALNADAAGLVDTLLWGAGGLVLTLGVIERSYSLAYRDELTGLPGRRALNEALRQQAGMYTLAMVDVDHFKRFNDRYGHDVGDQALRMVARQLARVDGGGAPFRYGGEEFTVIFPGKSSEEAEPFLEELRRSIARASFVRRGPLRPRRKPARPRAARRSPRRISLTVSMGASHPGPGRSKPEEVVKAADRLLYRSKKAGRNRVSI